MIEVIPPEEEAQDITSKLICQSTETEELKKAVSDIKETERKYKYMIGQEFDRIDQRIDRMQRDFSTRVSKLILRVNHFDRVEIRVKSDIAEIKDALKVMKVIVVAEFIALVVVLSVIAAMNVHAEDEPKDVITMEIDGHPTTLYIDEYDRIYEDAAFTVEFPNDDMEPWIYTGDPNMPFRMPVCD